MGKLPNPRQQPTEFRAAPGAHWRYPDSASLDPLPVVRRGTWSYDCVAREVRIVVSSKCYGSGDYQDEPEVADDRDEETFVVEYQTLNPTVVEFTGGGQFRSLDEAIRSVETLLVGKVCWHDAGQQG